MLCVHNYHFVLEAQQINCTVADTDALEVLNNLPRLHPCVKGNRLAQLGIPQLVKSVDDKDS